MNKRIAFKDLGISSSPTISNAYWEKKREQQARWALEDYWKGSATGQLKKKTIKKI